MSEPKYKCDMGDPLDMLVEECAEVIQEMMKVRRFGTVGAAMCLSGVVLLIGGGLYELSAGFIVFSKHMDGEAAFARLGIGLLIAFLGWIIAMIGSFCRPSKRAYEKGGTKRPAIVHRQKRG